MFVDKTGSRFLSLNYKKPPTTLDFIIIMKFTLLSILSATQAAILAKRDALMSISYYAGPDCAPKGACGIDCAKEDAISLNPGDSWDGFKLPGTNAVHSFKVKWNHANGDVGLRVFETCTGWSKLIWNGDEACYNIAKGVLRFELETGHSTDEHPAGNENCDSVGKNDQEVSSSKVATLDVPEKAKECNKGPQDWKLEALLSDKKANTGDKPILEAIREFRKNSRKDTCRDQLCSSYSFTPLYWAYGKKVPSEPKVEFVIRGNFNTKLDDFLDVLERVVQQEGLEETTEEGGTGRFLRSSGGPDIIKVKQYLSPSLYRFSMAEGCDVSYTFEFEVKSKYTGKVDWCETGKTILSLAGIGFMPTKYAEVALDLACMAADAMKSDDSE